MKIIVGLGNPGIKYQGTRHNAGFLAVDDFLKSLDANINPSCTKFNSELVEANLREEKIFFIKPTTFMNNSGQAVSEIVNFYKANAKEDLLIIHDDTDLNLGNIRLANNSSAAGHNGVQDIIDKLGSQEFNRIRIGVESRESRGEISTEAFVLQKFSNDEIEKLKKDILPQVKKEIENFLQI